MPDDKELAPTELIPEERADYDEEYAPRMVREAMRNMGAAESLLGQGRRREYRDHLRLAEAQLKLVETYETVMGGRRGF